MILFLKPLEKNTFAVFVGSSIIGAIAEYLMSYICELYFHFKWWDYSNLLLNVNGRTCLYFILIWGFLGTILIKYVNPKVDKFIEKIKNKLSKKVFDFAVFGIFLFLLVDILLTTFALKYFYAKISSDYQLPNSNYSAQRLENLSKFDLLDEGNLLKIFPNIRIAGNEMDNVFVDTLYNVDSTYYLKIFDK